MQIAVTRPSRDVENLPLPPATKQRIVEKLPLPPATK
jgi:hypothetical protein